MAFVFTQDASMYESVRSLAAAATKEFMPDVTIALPIYSTTIETEVNALVTGYDSLSAANTTKVDLAALHLIAARLSFLHSRGSFISRGIDKRFRKTDKIDWASLAVELNTEGYGLINEVLDEITPDTATPGPYALLIQNTIDNETGETRLGVLSSEQ